MLTKIITKFQTTADILRLLITAFLLLNVFIVPAIAAERSVHVKIFPNQYNVALEQFTQAGYDIVEIRQQTDVIELIIDEDILEDLSEYGTVEIINYSRPYLEIRQEYNAANDLDDAPDANYKTYAEVLTIMTNTQTAFPNIVQMINLTQTYGTPQTAGNRDMFALKISDNVSTNEDEPTILFDSLHHARELNTIEATLGLIAHLTSEYASNTQVKSFVDSLEIWVVPVVNPDGLEHVWSNYDFWRKNRRNNGSGNFGVDLNRNYPFEWGTCGANSGATSSDIYRGPSANSEPEVNTMLALGADIRPIIYNSYHSSGQEVLHPIVCFDQLADQALVFDIRDAYADSMNYAVRPPSSSGESYLWFYNQISSVSFLTEMDFNQFQPLFPTTVNEVETRLKPGWIYLLDILKNGGKGLVRGNVTNAITGSPVVAEISSSEVNYVKGERRASQPDFGRYGWFLEQGLQHTLTFTATGYHPANHFVSPNTTSAIDLNVQLQPIADPELIFVNGFE